MKEHYRRIYAEQASDYQRLVAREDHAGALLPAIRALHPLAGARVVELGAGTGRLTRLLAPWVDHITACDASSPMLAVAAAENARQGVRNVSLAVAGHHALPMPAGQADLAVEGWAFGHLMDQEDWQGALAAAIAELDRVTRPGGTQLIIETLGTGQVQPAPPSPALATLFETLEAQGFARSWCRTDYRFASRDEALALVGFFFGAAMCERLSADPEPSLAECTGLWSRVRPDEPAPVRP
jgi:ubiquinone/menaquinone biosynthesis C-methylase UbiE